MKYIKRKSVSATVTHRYIVFEIIYHAPTTNLRRMQMKGYTINESIVMSFDIAVGIIKTTLSEDIYNKIIGKR